MVVPWDVGSAVGIRGDPDRNLIGALSVYRFQSAKYLAQHCIEEGSQLTVRYTDKAGAKTAVGIEDVGKDTKKAVQ